MPNITRLPGAERTILFPFDPSSLLATLADWAHAQGGPNGRSWRERPALPSGEQPSIGQSVPPESTACEQHD